jgi:hypothetical protein
MGPSSQPPAETEAALYDEHDEGHSDNDQNKSPYQHRHQRAVGAGCVTRSADHGWHPLKDTFWINLYLRKDVL